MSAESFAESRVSAGLPKLVNRLSVPVAPSVVAGEKLFKSVRPQPARMRSAAERRNVCDTDCLPAVATRAAAKNLSQEMAGV